MSTKSLDLKDNDEPKNRAQLPLPRINADTPGGTHSNEQKPQTTDPIHNFDFINPVQSQQQLQQYSLRLQSKVRSDFKAKQKQNKKNAANTAVEIHRNRLQRNIGPSSVRSIKDRRGHPCLNHLSNVVAPCNMRGAVGVPTAVSVVAHLTL